MILCNILLRLNTLRINRINLIFKQINTYDFGVGRYKGVTTKTVLQAMQHGLHVLNA